MKLLKENGKYICQSSYDERHIPKDAGFRWDATRKCWWTDDSTKAKKLREYAKGGVEAYLGKVQQQVEQSRSTHSNISVPVPDGLEYMPFQKAAIAYAKDRKNVLFGDEMGLGKTIEAIGVLNLDKNPKKTVLVVCPASLKVNWKRELDKWLVMKSEVEIASSRKPFPKDARFVVINYDILKKHLFITKGGTNGGKKKFQYNGYRWDYLIVDECHYVKNAKAQRTKMIRQITATRRFFLTGTPIVNRPIELWSILQMLDPDTWKSFWGYAKRYCAAYHNGFGWDMSGASHLDELQQKLRRSIMVRRLKSEVLKDLPAKVRQVIEIPTNGCQKAVARETVEWEKHKERVESLRSAVEEARESEDEDQYKVAVKALRKGIMVAFTEMAAVRHQTAVAKIPYVLEHLTDVVESENKVIVFAHHHDVVDAIKEKFADAAVVVDGRVKPEDRALKVDRFQSDASCKLFVGSITAAGVGITLTAASHVVFAELDWVPGNISQAEDRCHRIGQLNSVLVQHLVFEGSIDAYMANMIVNKQGVIERALDAQTTEKPAIVEKKVTKKNLQWLETEKKEEPVNDRNVEAVQAAMKLLAGMCDGAHALDGHGFNKFDTEFGHSLAAQRFWSKKQFAEAKKMVYKYRRQIPADLFKSIYGDQKV